MSCEGVSASEKILVLFAFGFRNGNVFVVTFSGIF